MCHDTTQVPEPLQAHESFGGIAEDDWERLHLAAREAREHAHAPYSHFPVGAALLADSGEIFAGCNVENATIGATVCAERTAIGNAVVRGQRRFRALCVITNVARPSAPCGICRQVLAEFCDELPMMLVNLEGLRRFITLGELFPDRFAKSDFMDA